MIDIKKSLIVPLLVLSCATTATVVIVDTTSQLQVHADPASENYELVLSNSQNKYSSSSMTINTSSGNDVTFNFSNFNKVTDSRYFSSSNGNSVMSNVNAIRGLKSLTIEYADANSVTKPFEIKTAWGWETSDIPNTGWADCLYQEKKILNDNEGVVTFDFYDMSPSYFSLYIDDFGVFIKSITIDYSCVLTPFSLGFTLELSSTGTNYRICDPISTSIEKLYIPTMYNGLPIYGCKQKAFSDCQQLKKVRMGDLRYSNGGEFKGCKALEEVAFASTTSNIQSETFMDCTSLTKIVEFPSTIQLIGAYAFSNCGLTSVTLPEGLVYIYTRAFYGTPLTSVSLPNSLYDIQSEVFSYTNLTSLRIPKGVGNLIAPQFNGCEHFTTLTVDPENEKYTDQLPYMTSPSNAVYSKGFNELCLTCPTSVFPTADTFSISYNSLAEMSYPENWDLSSYTNMIRICGHAFDKCDRLVSISLPATRIDAEAFSDLQNLEYVFISKDFNAGTNETNTNCMFYNCQNLKKVYTDAPSSSYFTEEQMEKLTTADATWEIVYNTPSMPSSH